VTAGEEAVSGLHAGRSNASAASKGRADIVSPGWVPESVRRKGTTGQSPLLACI
jgi:hypothetical protein